MQAEEKLQIRKMRLNRREGAGGGSVHMLGVVRGLMVRSGFVYVEVSLLIILIVVLGLKLRVYVDVLSIDLCIYSGPVH